MTTETLIKETIMDTFEATKLTLELIYRLETDLRDRSWDWLRETLDWSNASDYVYYFVPNYINKFHTTEPHGCAIRADTLEEEFDFVLPQIETDTFTITRK